MSECEPHAESTFSSEGRKTESSVTFYSGPSIRNFQVNISSAMFPRLREAMLGANGNIYSKPPQVLISKILLRKAFTQMYPVDIGHAHVGAFLVTGPSMAPTYY